MDNKNTQIAEIDKQIEVKEQELLELKQQKVKIKGSEKFIMIMDAEQLEYLEWASQFRKLSKAEIVRSIVKYGSEQDTSYQNYQHQHGLLQQN